MMIDYYFKIFVCVNQLLTGWVDHKRPIGCPQMTWGRTLKKDLVQNNLPADFKAWSSLAADRR